MQLEWRSLFYVIAVVCFPDTMKSVQALMHEFPIRRQHCNREQCRPNIYIDPFALWDNFPCPPPVTHRRKLLLRVNWTGCLGLEYGLEVLKRTANRCHIELKDSDVLQNHPAATIIFDSSCDTYCHLAIVLVCLCVLFLILVIVVVILYRKTSKKGKPESPTTETTLNYRENKYYTQNGCPVLDGSTLVISRPYETRVVGDRAETRLANDVISNHYAPVDISYGRLQYERPMVNIQLDDPSHLKRHSGRDRNSSSCSSTDKSHIYEYITDHCATYQEPVDAGGASSDYCGDLSPEYDETSYQCQGRRSRHRQSPYPESTSEPHEQIPCLQQQSLNTNNSSQTLPSGKRKRRRRRRRPSSTASIKSESTTLSDSSFRSRDPKHAGEYVLRSSDTGTISENPVPCVNHGEMCPRSRNSVTRVNEDYQRFPNAFVVTYNPNRMPCDSNFFRSRGIPIATENCRIRGYPRNTGSHSGQETAYGSNNCRHVAPPSGNQEYHDRETPIDNEYYRRGSIPNSDSSQRGRETPAIIECSTFRSNVPITNGTLLTSTLAFR